MVGKQTRQLGVLFAVQRCGVMTVDPVAISLAVLLPVLVVREAKRVNGLPGWPRSVVLTFLFGASIVVPVLVVAIPVFIVVLQIQNPLVAGTLIAFGAAAVPEEFFKFQVVRRYGSKHIEPLNPRSGMLFGVAASLGFAAIENVGYASQGGVSVVLFRCFTAIPMHAALGAIMGYQFARAQIAFLRPTELSSTRPQYNGVAFNRQLGRAFLWPMLLHGIYDTPAIVVMVPILRSGKMPTEVGPGVVVAILIMISCLIGTIMTALRLGRIAAQEQRQCLELLEQQAGDQTEPISGVITP